MQVEVRAHITGTVWKIEVAEGQQVEPGQILTILESMKMELPIEAECFGTVVKVVASEGQPIEEGALIAVIDAT